MLSWHSIPPLQIEWNFLDQSPVFWSIRKPTQLDGSKVPLRHFYYIDRATAICRDNPFIPFGFVESYFFMICCWPSNDERQSWRCPGPDSRFPRHSYISAFANCAWSKFVKNPCFHFFSDPRKHSHQFSSGTRKIQTMFSIVNCERTTFSENISVCEVSRWTFTCSWISYLGSPRLFIRSLERFRSRKPLSIGMNHAFRK